MEKSLWLATAYVQAAHQLDQFVALAAFVQTREEFEQRALFSDTCLFPFSVSADSG
ncbi:hypothetical protein [Rodentibacter genomosp. 2]|uniref:hypothetical protein n=1 Tax=Rodentibacter genomosp. 2 TaxID=1908266 RepID=UPI0021176D98|nr:hypothetical protein [Rodentibacter genomosp. 2]